ncbi:hypothetical protein Tco_1132909 [Tanacetum coccineum]|uniref:Uncharacterized protein n=1 Tax=Tanacetum coccineum TaxID=301880 RepID=A0ABQ5JG54_9ASTR
MKEGRIKPRYQDLQWFGYEALLRPTPLPKRKKEKSLDYNNSFLDEYECSSLALDKEERRDEKKRLDQLKQDQTMQENPTVTVGDPGASNEFHNDERVTWVDIEEMPLKAWTKNTFTRIASKWGDLMHIEDEEEDCFHSKLFWIHTKEVPGWIYNFVEEEVEDNDSDSNPKDDELDNDIVDKQKYTNEGGDSDVEESQSEDPFKIYDLLNKKKHNASSDTSSNLSMKYPPGFTPTDDGKTTSEVKKTSHSEKIREWIKVKKDSSNNYKKTLKADLVEIDTLLDKGEGNSDILNKRFTVSKELQDIGGNSSFISLILKMHNADMVKYVTPRKFQVMAAPVIPISSDSSEESVPIVPIDPLVVPVGGAIFVTSPIGVLDLVDYSSSNSDLSEDSLPPALELSLVSPFLCSDDSEADIEVTSRPSSPSGSSSHDTFAPSSELPIAHVVAPPRIRRRLAILISPGEAIPFGRPYCTHSNRPHFTSDSSSSGSSSDSSSNTSLGSPSDSLSDTSSVHSSGCDASGQTHSGPSTIVVSSRLVYPPVMTLQYSEEYSRWTSAPLSTPYLPTTSKEEHMEIGAADAEAVADLGNGDRVGAHTKDGICIGVDIAASDIREDEEEFETEASAGDTMEIAVDPLVTGGISESTRGDVPDLEDTLYDIVHYMAKVPFDRIIEFETAHRQLEAGQLMASKERAGLTDRIKRLGLENLKIHRDRDDARRRLRRLESFVERRLGFRP